MEEIQRINQRQKNACSMMTYEEKRLRDGSIGCT
jgi:hypothetical protein